VDRIAAVGVGIDFLMTGTPFGGWRSARML
jgi:hypothetical protein